MADNARGLHVSPGVYTREIEILPAVRSLGITSLGVVGETPMGPAFEPMTVSNWREYTSLFGGTNPERFQGSKYPKYELPYIAKSYLNQSERLTVVRVLGLSGTNMGPAWCVTGKIPIDANGDDVSTGKTTNMVIAVIRSRGHYEQYYKFGSQTGNCECQYQSYDTLLYDVGEKTQSECNQPKEYNLEALQIGQYIPFDSTGNECVDYKNVAQPSTFEATTTDYGHFKLFGWTGQYEDSAISATTVQASADSATTVETTSAYVVNVMSGETLLFKTASKKGYEDPNYFEYPVSLNPLDNDYIIKVLGTTAYQGDAPIYVESLYDVAWQQQINSLDLGESIVVNNDLTRYQAYHASDYCCFEPFTDFMTKQEEQLTRSDVGRRFMATHENVKQNYHCHLFSYKTGKPVTKGSANYAYDENGNVTGNTEWAEGISYTGYSANASGECTGSNTANCYSETVEVTQNVQVGQIYTVAQYTDSSGKRHYYYRYYSPADGYLKYLKSYKNIDINPILDKLSNQTGSGDNSDIENYIAKCSADELYYRLDLISNHDSGTTEIGKYDVYPVKLDLNNYKSQYRFASTPWFVSDLKGDFTHYELNKLFRFHTISDGDAANTQIKVSICNIDFDNGLFDVYVRDINDTDNSPVVLERYTKCNLIPGSSNYLGYKMGTYDGAYETVSQYITAEIIENDSTYSSVPCGFMGYPIHDYSGLPITGKPVENVIMPILRYNLDYSEEIKNKKQYFGLSDIVGVDVDAFTFKGNVSYYEEPSYVSQGFHLDSRLDVNGYNSPDDYPTITVDGVYGYSFDAVSVNNRTTILDGMPIIGKEDDMEGSIYKNKDLRKFTAYFYGGYDGWDVYRDQRSNGDNFRKTFYMGDYDDKSGEGYNFNKITNPTVLGLDVDGITSDYYAYLAGIKQFSNKESVDVNVIATPGIDYVNQKSLVEETIEMVEEERGDSIYIVTTPDKPSGAEDYIDEMYTPEDVAYNLEDSEIDSNYTATYYPWVKYFDQDNNQYIMLPPTKDVVRNIALTDNTSFSWFAIAGYTRGNVDCTRAHFVTKIGDEDTLYEGRINPIKTFARDGVKIWGQKTLQVADSQLNRLNVRRLLLRIKKLVTDAAVRLVFEPNDTTTAASFRSLIDPILSNVKSNRGITDYYIEIDDSVEARMRMELPAKIFIKPTPTLEYIDISFIITPENVSFDDIQ